MDEMEIDGKNYLSSKKAAQLTGYAKDYVGQLCREGRVKAKLIGRSWYVSEDSIRAHRFGNESEKREEKVENPVATEVLVHHEQEIDKVSEITNKQATWESPTYVPEVPEEMIPLVEKKVTEESPVDIEAMQSAWKEWFERMPLDKEPDNDMEESVSEEHKEEQVVPIHRVEPDPIPHQAQEMDVVAVSKIEDVYSPLETRASVRSEYRTRTVKTEEKEEKGKESSFLTIKAVCVALIILVLSLTSIALGVRTPFTPTSSSNVPLIDYIEGQTNI